MLHTGQATAISKFQDISKVLALLKDDVTLHPLVKVVVVL